MTRLLVALLAILALAGCGDDPDYAADPAGGAIVDIADVEPLREQFNGDKGSARLLIVLSPT